MAVGDGDELRGPEVTGVWVDEWGDGADRWGAIGRRVDEAMAHVEAWFRLLPVKRRRAVVERRLEWHVERQFRGLLGTLRKEIGEDREVEGLIDHAIGVMVERLRAIDREMAVTEFTAEGW